MKKYFFFAATALALTACTSDDFIGTEKTETGAEEMAITFSGGAGKVQRAVQHGADAATLLDNKFVVYGWKTPGISPNPRQVVYDHYTLNYTNGSALSTPSNSAGWEYVNQTLNMLSSLSGSQEIKYWDFAATTYDFIAFSTGTIEQVEAEGDIEDGKVYVTAITPTSTPVSPDTYTGPKYTIKGAVDDLAKCYIADRVSAANNVAVGDKIDNRYIAYKDAVQFNFRSLGSKVRLAIYEKIPGYSVKDVKFYVSGSDDAPTTTPALYAAAANIPGGTGTMTVTFPTTDKAETDYNKAHVAFTGGTNASKINFSALTYTTAEKNEAAGTIYLGRESSSASYAGNTSAADHAYVSVLPAEVGALTLKVDYTLVAKDGSGEEIKVKGATAVVPAEYCKWQPNYAYTYLFKITDKTSGTIGDDPAGLYPITFDAIVTETEDGVQETITTVADPSITTYAKDAVKDEYCAGDNIYVNVQGITVSSSNLKLYTAVLAAGADQELTEAAVANCLANGTESPSGTWTVTDKDSKTLVVTATADNFMKIVSEIDAADAPDGNAVTLANKAGKFTAAGSTIYVVEYNAGGSPAVKHYKVIRVGSTTRS